VPTSWRTIPASMCSANREIWRRWHYSEGFLFSWNGLGALVIPHGNLNTEGYKDILTRCLLSTVEDQFGDDCTSMTMLPAIKQGLSGTGLWTIRL
jgi:hypothetical protein